jgi:hypothetical protein
MTTGTGKHGHKDTQEPWPHHDGSGKQASHSGNEQGKTGSSQGAGKESKESLHGREYKDEHGEVHHHTKTYMEQHGKKE